MLQRSARLAEYIRTKAGFEIVTSIDGNYAHMGATLTDAVLQRGAKCKTVLRPRVQRLLAEYPHARTTTVFAGLLSSVGGEGLLKWKGKQKLKTLTELTALLRRENVEAEDEFRAWIKVPGNAKRLRQIKGIKDKTAHYIEILLGVQNVAVDRHLFRFLTEAGLETSNYESAHLLLRETAELLGFSHPCWTTVFGGICQSGRQLPNGALQPTGPASAVCRMVASAKAGPAAELGR